MMLEGWIALGGLSVIALVGAVAGIGKLVARAAEMAARDL
jgi:hypothetical protein